MKIKVRRSLSTKKNLNIPPKPTHTWVRSLMCPSLPEAKGSLRRQDWRITLSNCHQTSADTADDGPTGRTDFSSDWGWEPRLPGKGFHNRWDKEMTTVQLNSEFPSVCKHSRQLWSKEPPFLPHCQTLCYEHSPEVTHLISHRKSFTKIFISKHERQPTFSNAFNNKYWNRGISESPGLTPTPVCLASQCYRGEKLSLSIN